MPAPLLPGTLLIASPNLDDLGELEHGDPNFNRTVVMLLQHTDEGSIGLVINRPLGEKIKLYTSEALERLTDGLQTIQEVALEPASMFYQGGPVGRGALVFLHQLGDTIPDSTEVCDGIYAGGDLDTLRMHASVVTAEKPLLRFYLGYAGWNPGQLENEIERRDSWILSPGNARLVFSTEPDQIWQKALHSLGDKYRALSLLPEDLSLN